MKRTHSPQEKRNSLLFERQEASTLWTMVRRGNITDEMAIELRPKQVEFYLERTSGWERYYRSLFQLSGPDGDGPGHYNFLKGWQFEGKFAVKLKYETAAGVVRDIAEAEMRGEIEVLFDLLTTKT